MKKFKLKFCHKLRSIKYSHHILNTGYKILISFIISACLLAGAFLWFTRRPITRQAADSYFGLDEGYGSSIHDTAGSATGTITNAVWKPESFCRSGSCLYFDGTGDFVDLGDDDNFDFAASDSFTINLWFRHTGNISDTQVLVAKHNATAGGYKIYMNSNGTVVFGIDDDSTWDPDASVTSTNSYTDNKWHFLSAVKTGTTGMALYIDALNVGTNTGISGIGSLANSDHLYLGIDGNGSSYGWVGYIDDFKVYTTSARTSDELKADYTGQTASRGLSESFGDDSSNLSEGLVGYWDFDESSGNATDHSGNGNNLTNNNTATYTSGKFGNGTSLAASSTQFFSASDNPSLSITGSLTLSGWIKPASTTSSTQFDIAGKWDGDTQSYLLAQYGDEIRFYVGSSSNYVTTTSSNLQTGSWYFVTGIYTNVDQTIKIYINGQSQTTSSNGTIPSSISDMTDNYYIGADSNGANITIERQVSSNDDDKDEADADNGSSHGGYTYMTSSTSPGNRWNSGFRFTNITIPQGNSVSTAYVSIWPDSDTYDDPNADIFAEDVDNSDDFVTNSDVTGRTRTTASVSWSATGIGSSGYTASPEIKTVIQEILDRGTWSGGNALTLLIDGKNASPGNFRTQDYSGAPTHTPILHIEYTSSALNPFDGVIDEVRLYNRTLSPGEVMDLYQWAPGPVGYWKLDEGTGTSEIIDSSGNNSAGTMNGSMTYEDWVPGKFGNALDFDGADDYISIDDNDRFSFGNGTSDSSFSVGVWIKPRAFSGQLANFIVSKDDSFSIREWSLSLDTSGKPQFILWDDSLDGSIARSYNTALTLNQWYHLQATYDGSGSSAGLKIYLNGARVDDTNISSGSYTAMENGTETVRIASWDQNNNHNFNGVIDDVKVYNYARTPAQITQDMNAGHPAPGSPVGSSIGYWDFEEGYGDIAHNTGSGSTSLDGNLGGAGQTCPASGTIPCPSWTNNGKFGRALSFDGTDDYVEGSIDMDYSEPISVSAWVYPTYTNGTGTQSWAKIVSQPTSTHSDPWVLYALGTDDSSPAKFVFSVSSGTAGQDNGAGFATAISANHWYHLVGTYDGNNIKLYVNGKLDSVTPFTVSLGNSTEPLVMGAVRNDMFTNNVFKGVIDEVKVYNFALTADQVKAEYNQGVATVFGSLSTDSSGTAAAFDAARSYCPPGNTEGNCASGQNPAPIGEWKFNENSGTTAYDTSGNNFSGTLGGGTETYTPTWSIGKEGSALVFDGSNDYVEFNPQITALNGKSAMTTSAWIKPAFASNQVTSNYKTPLALTSNGTGGPNLQIASAGSYYQLACQLATSVTGWAGVYSYDYVTWNANTWHYFTCRYTGSKLEIYWDGKFINSDDFTGTITNNTSASSHIGNFGGSSDPFNGSIDQIRIYDYARTPAQIAWDYNRGAPVAQWDFDECSLNVLHDTAPKTDRSSTNHNGTIYAQTGNSIGTCGGSTGDMWADGTVGKYSSSLSFDGTDDYVDITDDDVFDIKANQNYTWAMWIKPSSLIEGDWQTIWSQNVTSSTPNFFIYALNIDGSGTGEPQWGPVTNGISAGWNHAVNRTIRHTTNNVISVGNWAHIVVTYDASKSQADRIGIYVNGVDRTDRSDIESGGTVGDITTTNIRIGNNQLYGEYFPGQIDDIRVYNYLLTPQQINLIYNQSSAVRF